MVSQCYIDMPDKCCVPHCRGNYKSGPKVRAFRFPQNEEVRKAWISAIPRKNLVVSQYTSVCELHFKYDDIIRESSYVDTATGRTVTAPLTHLRLRPDAVPSKFPGLPDSNKPRRLLPILPATALTAITVTTIDPDRVLSVKDLADYVRSKESAFWHAIESSERLIFVHIVEDGAPWIKYSVVVEADLSLTLHFAKTPITRLGSNVCVPSVASSKSVVMALLESVEKWDGQLDSNSEKADEVICETIRSLLAKLSSPDSEGRAAAVTFMIEQLELLTTKNSERRHYSADFMVFCCLLFTISPHAYNYIRNNGSITLPHPMTIRSMCSSLKLNPHLGHQGPAFLSYVAKRILQLDFRERLVIVTVDEICLKAYFDYKGGDGTGVALNAAGVANSVFVFMVQSFTCQFKEVAHVVPVHIAEPEFLHKVLRDIICGLEKIGYRVVCVVTDSSPVNREAMSHFSSPPTKEIVYPHPSDPTRPLFFVIDPVHILKCIRNDWLDQKNEKMSFHFPEFTAATAENKRVLSASFVSLREAYKFLADKTLRYGHRITKNALCPSSVERENTELAVQIFNSSLPYALRSLGLKQNQQSFEETASFIEIIVKWWKIASVKSPYKQKRIADQFQEPVMPSVDDPRVDFLYKLLDWLDDWKSKELDDSTLTEATHAALQQTTHAFVEISRYCFLELKLPYVLLGKIRTEGLEQRFGKCKQPVCYPYHASIRQPYEDKVELWNQEKPPPVTTDIEKDAGGHDEQWKDLYKQADMLFPACNIAVTEDTLSEIKDMIPILIYVTGHAVCATLKKLCCEKCQLTLTVNRALTIQVSPQHRDLAKELDRGGAVFPTMFAVNAVAHAYVVVEQLVKQPLFLNMSNQRQIVTDLTVELLVNEATSDFDACGDGHTGEHVLRLVLWCATNVLLKKFASVVQERSVRVHRMIRKKPIETIAKQKKLKATFILSAKKPVAPVAAPPKPPAKPAKVRLHRLNCEHCEFFTDDNKLLASHYGSKHPEQALMACDKCQAHFTHRAYVLMHQAEVHYMPEEEEVPQTCSVCDLPLENRYALRDHLVEEHAPPSVYRCDMCGEEFCTTDSLFQHRNEAHNPKSLECPHCPKKFKSAWHCRRHVLCSHRSSRLLNSCKHCFRRYKDLLTLRYHMALSHMRELTEEEKASVEPLKKRCPQCDFVTFNRRSMKVHLRRKHGEMLQCGQCPSRFAQMWELTRHRRLHHGTVGRQDCPHCPRGFVCPKAYATHVTMHQEGQGHECAICRCLFESEAMLTSHVEKHTNPDSRRCTGCLRVFTSAHHLARHQKTHSKEGPDGTVVLNCPKVKNPGRPGRNRASGEGKGQGRQFTLSCDQCHLSFKFQSSLTAHKMTAHGNSASKDGKSFTCEICQRSCTTMLALSEHIRTHTGERPYVCGECGAAFSQPGTLRDHAVRKHSRAFRHTCPLCGKGCVTKYALRKHLQNSHKATVGEQQPRGGTAQQPSKQQQQQPGSSAATASPTKTAQPTVRRSRTTGASNVPARAAQEASRRGRPSAVPTSSAPPVLPVAAAASAAFHPGTASAYMFPNYESQDSYEPLERCSVILHELEPREQQQQQQRMVPHPHTVVAPPTLHQPAGPTNLPMGMDSLSAAGWRLPGPPVAGFELIYSPQPAHHEQAMSSLSSMHGTMGWSREQL